MPSDANHTKTHGGTAVGRKLQNARLQKARRQLSDAVQNPRKRVVVEGALYSTIIPELPPTTLSDNDLKAVLAELTK